jgi:putative cell wall-binding protein
VDISIQQALTGWPQGATSVVLARSDDFPDALAGVPLAAQLDAPVLLTSPKGLDSRIQAALKTLNPGKVYLLGGEGALSAQVSTDLKTLGWDSGKQIRISGANRYETAAQIAQASTGAHPAVVIATGENFPDALGIASIAGRKNMPILLTSKSQVPQETSAELKLLNPTQIYLIGGEGVISATVAQKLQASLSLPSSGIIRLAGATRYDTMAAVGEAFEGEIQGLSFATGEDFPNALTGAALAAHQNQTLILLPATSLDSYPELNGLITRHLSQSATQPYLSGDIKAIPQALEAQLTSLLTS